jgi:hypothetical protein
MNHGELFGKLMIQDILRNIWESYHIMQQHIQQHIHKPWEQLG